jgi:hypothetical protein
MQIVKILRARHGQHLQRPQPETLDCHATGHGRDPDRKTLHRPEHVGGSIRLQIRLRLCYLRHRTGVRGETSASAEGFTKVRQEWPGCACRAFRS